MSLIKQLPIKNFWLTDVLPDAVDKPKGKTIYWQGSDSLEKFKANPVPGYDETSITYTFNSQGFREEEFDLTNGRKKILCLGCSHTEGIGLRLEDAWVTKLKKHFPDHDVYNLGWGGGSTDTVARLLANSAGVFKPEAVFILWPDKNRYEMYLYASLLLFKGTWNMEKGEIDYYDPAHTRNIFYKNKVIVDLLREKYNFKLYELMSDELNTDRDFGLYYRVDQSRDGHFSAAQHTIIVDRFMEQYNASK